MSADASRRNALGAGEVLTQLIYRSTSTVNITSVMEMSDILDEARQRNTELAITGALTIVGGTFVQIIEGPAAGIEILLAKLIADPRHTGLSVLDRREVRARSFGDWDMVSPRLVPTEARELALLLQDDQSSLLDFIPILTRAVARQDAVLEGVEAPANHPPTLPTAKPLARRFRVDPKT